MSGRSTKRRVLALELRKSCIGYAVFQGPKQLLDWGTTSVSPQHTANERAAKKVLLILKLLSPTIIVIKHQRGTASGAILKRIRTEATRHFIPIVVIGRERFQQAFGAGNKDKRAEMLTRVYPELLFKLPRKRRAWTSEPHAMLVFDAIATGFAFWSSDYPGAMQNSI